MTIQTIPVQSPRHKRLPPPVATITKEQHLADNVEPKDTVEVDRVIMRRDLRELFGVTAEAVRQWIAAGKLPPLDVNLTRRVQGWRISTLRAHGINIP